MLWERRGEDHCFVGVKKEKRRRRRM